MFQNILFITRDFLALHSGSYNIPYRYPTETKKAPNDKPNSLKHHKHIVPKLQETQPLYQTDSNACHFNSTTVCPG